MTLLGQAGIVALESAPRGFGGQIIQATNFQNAVVYSDFAAMDPVWEGEKGSDGMMKLPS
jgi:hypothetical protein